ncbi:hypothetical protein GL213_02435 [Halogeometricum borinquense]|uniref:Polyprenyl synthetase n=1 Tax=Halogeometricum borinquense TaxID=60847 RepID=A0A6C0UPX5_9EURY|nr:hypothetical protein [Halogeometricum borinquense]QIB75929.1 hypothetical protein G3I44_17575 [Halogeometricum borinquense]QIQ75489.1 hypothetical protein GL213_02435 [Halogeometricum borinquense]
MDDAVRARDAAREALDDIEPDRLREVLFDRLDETSMTPGALTILSARALKPGVDADADGLAERAAGVQLIYEGLRLTRTLTHEEPWLTADGEDIDGDMDVLAADVLVSRGFYVLARTNAAKRAVEVVRSFGRDQTLRQEQDDAETLDRNLEADIFTLAVVAGTTAVGGDAPPALLEYAAELARECDTNGALPPAAAAFSDATTERIASLSVTSATDDRVPSSATDR